MIPLDDLEPGQAYVFSGEAAREVEGETLLMTFSGCATFAGLRRQGCSPECGCGQVSWWAQFYTPHDVIWIKASTLKVSRRVKLPRPKK